MLCVFVILVKKISGCVSIDIVISCTMAFNRRLLKFVDVNSHFAVSKRSVFQQYHINGKLGIEWLRRRSSRMQCGTTKPTECDGVDGMAASGAVYRRGGQRVPD